MKRILPWERLLVFFTLIISICAYCYFYLHGQENLSNYDALARLDIARKMVDSITPGVGQLGAIWLPFPIVLMLPFIWSNFLWHNGLAGGLISGGAFVVGALFLYKTAYLLTKNILASLLVWFIFVTNINILLFQTMAMSESLFIFSMILTIYFLTKWLFTDNIISFLAAALFVMVGTLTRYEGYFILFSSLVVVGIKLLVQNWKKRNFHKVEGLLLVFLTIAGFGVYLWCLYNLLFFKDPFYWLHIYSGGTTAISTPTSSSQNTIGNAFFSYFEIAIWMSGILVSFLAVLGYIILICRTILQLRGKRFDIGYMPLIVISSVLFLLLVYGYQRGYIPHVTFESITVQHILNKKKFNIFPGSSFGDAPNIRYGLVMAPFFALLVGYLVSFSRTLVVIAFVLVCTQIVTVISTPYMLQFSVPKAARYIRLPAAAWFKNHYVGGLVLTSATTNENFIFQTGLPYDDFIYEGTRQYWTRSLSDPSWYATWVVYQTKDPGDVFYINLNPKVSQILKKKYRLVYSDKNGYFIYQLTDTP